MTFVVFSFYLLSCWVVCTKGINQISGHGWKTNFKLNQQCIFGPPKRRLELMLVLHWHRIITDSEISPLLLTNVVQPNPVSSIHFLLYVPHYDKVLATVQCILQGGRRQWGPALGGNQVCVTVSAWETNGTADHRDGIDGGSTASLRQVTKVFWAEGVPEMGATSAWGWQVVPASHREVWRVVGARPGW